MNIYVHANVCVCVRVCVWQKCKVNIRFSPTLSDEAIRREAVSLIVAEMEKARDAEEQQQQQQQQQRLTEVERDAAAQEIQVI